MKMKVKTSDRVFTLVCFVLFLCYFNISCVVRLNKVDWKGQNNKSNTDKEILITIIEKFNGGPVGIDSLATAIGEEVSTIEDMYEPYLIQIGYIKRTSRGRIVTDECKKYFNKIDVN